MDGHRGGRKNRKSNVIQDPPFARTLFGDTRFAWLWLVARVSLGWLWLDAGRNKLRDDAWMDGGSAVKGYWERSVQAPAAGQPPIAYDWYRNILQFMLDHRWHRWVAPMVAVGETLLGIALILGLATGLIAFLGSFLNVNFMLVGAASTNPITFVLAIALMLAWKTAGWVGLDRWVLPTVATLRRADAARSDGPAAGGRAHPERVAS